MEDEKKSPAGRLRREPPPLQPVSRRGPYGAVGNGLPGAIEESERRASAGRPLPWPEPSRPRLTDALASQDRLGREAVEAASARDNWKPALRQLVVRAWTEGSLHGYESRALEETTVTARPYFDPVAWDLLRSAFAEHGGELGTAVSYLMRGMPEAAAAAVIESALPTLAAAAPARPLPKRRRNAYGPLCPSCGHHHDPEFLCEEDCVTCAIAESERLRDAVAFRNTVARARETGLESVEAAPDFARRTADFGKAVDKYLADESSGNPEGATPASTAIAPSPHGAQHPSAALRGAWARPESAWVPVPKEVRCPPCEDENHEGCRAIGRPSACRCTDARCVENRNVT